MSQADGQQNTHIPSDPQDDVGAVDYSKLTTITPFSKRHQKQRTPKISHRFDTSQQLMPIATRTTMISIRQDDTDFGPMDDSKLTYVSKIVCSKCRISLA